MTKSISLFDAFIGSSAKVHEIHNDHKDNNEEQNTSDLFELFITAHSVPVDNDHGQETGHDAHDGCRGTHRAARVQVWTKEVTSDSTCQIDASDLFETDHALKKASEHELGNDIWKNVGESSMQEHSGDKSPHLVVILDLRWVLVEIIK